MTLFECVKAYLSASGSLAAKVTGGFHPGVIPQNRTEGQIICVMRYVSGASQPPTHDGGASPWSQVRIELTFWGQKYKDLEQCAMMAGNLFVTSAGVYLGGSNNGLFSCRQIQGPRSLTDPETRLFGVQTDVIGLLNGNTLS